MLDILAADILQNAYLSSVPTEEIMHLKSPFEEMSH